MALRNIRTVGDDVLRKTSKPVEEVNDRIKILIKDMIDTMYESDGVGLAAPQVGILKRVIVIDVGDGPIALVNPEITHSEGSAVDEEGCLSVPEQLGEVVRPYKLRVKGLNENGDMVEYEGEELFARAICHEIDHLDGVLFIDKVIDKKEK